MAAFENVLEEFVDQRDSFSRPDDKHFHPGFVLSIDRTAFREFCMLELADWEDCGLTSVTQAEVDKLRTQEPEDEIRELLRRILGVTSIDIGVERMKLIELDGAPPP
jgi:hypothetical protein